jgi:hypothetical protein
MTKFTLHNEHGDFMSDTARTLESGKDKCLKATYKCRLFETYMAKSPWRPWDDKLVEHGREVFRNYPASE